MPAPRIRKAARTGLPAPAAAAKCKATAGSQREPAAATVEGGLLALTPAGVVGWAWAPQSPVEPLHVILAANDSVVGAGLANRFDIELVRSRVGPGVPGFVISIGQPPSGSFPLRLTLRDRVGQVLGMPLILADESTFANHIHGRVAGPYEGMIDGLRDGFLVGWARSLTEPENALIVELYDGAVRLARQRAQLLREDLDLAGKGKCGFAFELPITLLDDRVHSLRVAIAGTDLELKNGPVQFGRLVTSKLVEEVTRLRQETARLRALVETIVDPGGQIQSEIIRTLSERIGAFATIQRDLVERELDALRTLALRQDHSAASGGMDASPAVRTSGTSSRRSNQLRHKVA